MFDRVPVYAYLLGALGSLVIGLGLLYAGMSRAGPVFLFGFVLLMILAAIRFTTPPIASAPAHESSPATHESSLAAHESLPADASTTHDDPHNDS
jgi:hypothetical protein